jgi:hypothetical protein
MDVQAPTQLTATSRDGTRIAYWRTGDGPALILVHGTTADHSRWETVLPLLEPHVTVYAMDRRGAWGEACRMERQHRLPEVFDDLRGCRVGVRAGQERVNELLGRQSRQHHGLLKAMRSCVPGEGGQCAPRTTDRQRAAFPTRADPRNPRPDPRSRTCQAFPADPTRRRRRERPTPRP